MERGFRVGDWQIRPDVGNIIRGNKQHQLEPKVMSVLVYLAEHAGDVLTKERLLQAVWSDTFVTEDVLRRAIFELRKAFGDDPQDPHYIRTLPRRGFQLIAEVVFPEEVEESSDRFQVINPLGRGAMAEVYLAHDTKLDRKVALKFLLPEMEGDTSWARRLRREARAGAALDHPFICKIYDTGRLDGRSFIAMEYIEGQTLKERLKKGPLPFTEALRIALEMAESLETAHRHGIIHRDIKPSNILLTEQGHVKITDFGIAKRIRPAEGEDQDWTETLTEEASTLGTLPYMSPEQVRGQPLDQRSDLFSFGVVLYEMLTGQNPFYRPVQTETIGAILHQQPAPVGEANSEAAGLEDCLRRMLAKEPEDRYQSATEVLKALRSHPVLGGKAESLQERLWRKITARLWYGAAALLVLMVIAAGSYLLLLSTQKIDSIAVLPLRNSSGDPQQEYLTDGMTEELIRELAQIRALRVISFTSVRQYKGQQKTVPEIARELGVDAVVEGTVSRGGDQVRVTAQLIRANPEGHMLSEKYERALSDIPSLQSDLVRAICREIGVVVTPQEEALLTRAEQVDPEAYVLYLQGRYQLSGYRGGSLLKAIELFELAVGEDPEFAPAYAALAESYFLRAAGYAALSPHETMPRARAAAQKALELDDNLAEAHLGLALVQESYDWDWDAARRSYQRALELKPNAARIHFWYAGLLVLHGRGEEALAEMELAHGFDPLGLEISNGIGWTHYWNQDFDSAIAQYKSVIERDAGFAMAHYNLGVAYADKGMHEQAIAEHRLALDLGGGDTHLLALLGRAYALAGRRGEARQILDQLLERSKQGYVSGFLLALVYLALGEKEEALDSLEKAYAERCSLLPNLKREHWCWKTLGDNRRFQELLKRMNFPEG